jgi:two-component system OmpR family response regulator
MKMFHPSGRKVMLVEDDALFATLIGKFLEKHGFEVAVETRGDLAVGRILGERPDAVILDATLPGLDGFDVCREVRGRFSGPILMLTGRSEDMDQVLGLELGADDYIAKPAEPRVVLARLRARLRRAGHDDEPAPLTTLHFGCLLISQNARRVELDGRCIDVTTAEFDLLWHLASHAGEIVTRDDIFTALRGIEYDGLDRSIDMRISRLRKLLGDDAEQPRRIKTVRGKGYLFSPGDWD